MKNKKDIITTKVYYFKEATEFLKSNNISYENINYFISKVFDIFIVGNSHLNIEIKTYTDIEEGWSKLLISVSSKDFDFDQYLLYQDKFFNMVEETNDDRIHSLLDNIILSNKDNDDDQEKKFIVVQKTNLPDFERTVNELINEGYCFHGETKIINQLGPSGTILSSLYTQPMLKE